MISISQVQSVNFYQVRHQNLTRLNASAIFRHRYWQKKHVVGLLVDRKVQMGEGWLKPNYIYINHQVQGKNQAKIEDQTKLVNKTN